jgi:hypothetical protein
MFLATAKADVKVIGKVSVRVASDTLTVVVAALTEHWLLESTVAEPMVVEDHAEQCPRSQIKIKMESQVAHQRRWPGGDHRTLADVFAEERLRLLPPPLHAFSTDRIEAVRSGKTIYLRFDLSDYSIPPEAVGRQLTLAASDVTVRICRYHQLASAD